jgi:hypothetical protein
MRELQKPSEHSVMGQEGQKISGGCVVGNVGPI